MNTHGAHKHTQINMEITHTHTHTHTYISKYDKYSPVHVDMLVCCLEFKSVFVCVCVYVCVFMYGCFSVCVSVCVCVCLCVSVFIFLPWREKIQLSSSKCLLESFQAWLVGVNRRARLTQRPYRYIM